MMDRERTALEFLDKHPKVDVAIEVLCTVLFALLPIVLVAF
jgi:hypothetical protein